MNEVFTMDDLRRVIFLGVLGVTIVVVIGFTAFIMWSRREKSERRRYRPRDQSPR